MKTLKNYLNFNFKLKLIKRKPVILVSILLFKFKLQKYVIKLSQPKPQILSTFSLKLMLYVWSLHISSSLSMLTMTLIIGLEIF